MVKPIDRMILIQSLDGSSEIFNCAMLQSQLVSCFISAGLAESSFLAEDIALAVESALLSSERDNLVFGRGELDLAVVRMLEETGFPEVGRMYRRIGGDADIVVGAEPEIVKHFLRKFLACEAEDIDWIAAQVCEACAKLELGNVAPHLLMELARHYERQLLTGRSHAATTHRDSEVLAEVDEILAKLPESARLLFDQNVLKFHGATKLFPSIRFVFSMNELARVCQFAPPVTEMEIEPRLYACAADLEVCRQVIGGIIRGRCPEAGELPVYLNIGDMYDFTVNYLGCSRLGGKKIGGELAAILASHLAVDDLNLTL